MQDAKFHDRECIGFAKVSLDGRFVGISAELQKILGHDAENLERYRFQDITHQDDLLRDEAQLERLLSQGHGAYSMVKRYVRSDGSLVWAELDVSLVRSGVGNPAGFLSRIRPVAMDDVVLEDLHNRALRDPVTRLFNRASFDEQLTAWVQRAHRLNTQFAVVLIDLDDFKRINDTFGHDAGDNVLAAVADRLNLMIGPGDFAARIGGDEFVVLSSIDATPDETTHFERRLLAGFAAPLNLSCGDVSISASVGSCVYPDDAATPSELVKKADARMYLSKQREKQQVK